jgi:hypothetical protein
MSKRERKEYVRRLKRIGKHITALRELLPLDPARNHLFDEIDAIEKSVEALRYHGFPSEEKATEEPLAGDSPLIRDEARRALRGDRKGPHEVSS